MREEDYADVPDEVMADYFAKRDRRRSRGSCTSCAHYGCCDSGCGGRYWVDDNAEDEAEDEEEI